MCFPPAHIAPIKFPHVFWEERSKLLRAWVENNEDSGLVEAAVHFSKENEHELEGGKDLMTVADMIKAGFSTLLGQNVIIYDSMICCVS